MRTPEISIIIPCYNEIDNINPTIDLLHESLNGIEWESIFVDDMSPDKTIEAIRQRASTDPRVRGILRLNRRGLSSAAIEGMLSSSATYVAVMDGDLQHDTNCLREMLHSIKNDDFDIIVASRNISGGSNSGLSSPFRKFLSKYGNLTISLFAFRIKDPMSGFFLMRQNDFEKISPRLSGRGFKILLDILLNVNSDFRVKEIPMKFKDRLYGESKLNMKVIYYIFYSIIHSKIGKFYAK